MCEDKIKDLEEKFESYKEIANHARSEISWVRTAYKWLISIVGILLFVGMWFTYSSVEDFKSGQQVKLEQNMQELKTRVEERIDQEFKKENIQQMVKEKARERIDVVAERIIEEKINPKINDIEEKYKIIDAQLESVEKDREEFKKQSEFTITVISAQNDDRLAFDQLKRWSEDKAYHFNQQASKAWQSILDEHASPFTLSGFTVPWKEGADPSVLTIDDIRANYEQANSYIRLALTEYAWNREDFSKKEKMNFLVDVIKEDKSLKVVEYASRLFQKESKQRIKPLAIEPILKWWEEHKNSI